jgi:hypothetical protein
MLRPLLKAGQHLAKPLFGDNIKCIPAHHKHDAKWEIPVNALFTGSG